MEAADSRGMGTVRYPRLLAKDDECAKQLAKRTLTTLYNPAARLASTRALPPRRRRLRRLRMAPELADDEILSRLLALNLARAAAD